MRYLFVIFILFANTVAMAEVTFFMGFVDNKDGTVTDPRNGLVWKRCVEGLEFSNNQCVGNASKIAAKDAKQVASSSRFLGFSDWRLPTFSEFASIASTSKIENKTEPRISMAIILHDNNDCGRYQETCKENIIWLSDKNPDPEEWLQQRYWYDHLNDPNYVGCINQDCGLRSCWSSSSTNTHYVRLVRSSQNIGGIPSDEFLNELQNKAAEQRRQEAEKQAQQRREEARQRQEAQAQERKVAVFRKSLKEGDDTSNGVVIQVKGNLIKIQTNESQCSQRDYQSNCTNYINTPAEKWFKRSEVYPQ